MKRNLTFLFLMFSFFSCTDDDMQFSSAELDSNNPLVGKWQLVKSSYSPGTAEQYWKDVENGYILNLKKDSSFESDQRNTLESGSYDIEGDKLILDYGSNREPSEYSQKFALSGDTLSLSPVRPVVCIEGCTSKLVRIK